MFRTLSLALRTNVTRQILDTRLVCAPSFTIAVRFGSASQPAAALDIRSASRKRRRAYIAMTPPESPHLDQPISHPPRRVAAYCTAQSYDFDSLLKFLRSKGSALSVVDNVIYTQRKPSSAASQHEVFYFRDGSFVAWGTDAQLDTLIASDLRQFETEHNLLSTKEEFSFQEGKYSGINGDAIFIGSGLSSSQTSSQTSTSAAAGSSASGTTTAVSNAVTTIVDHSSTGNHHIGASGNVVDNAAEIARQVMHDKLAFSYGLARSVKLEVLEANVDAVVSTMRGVPADMARSGRLSLSQRQITRRMGALLELRAQLNLHNQLQDTPDVYWEERRLEALFNKISAELEVHSRVSQLNKKLDYCHELVDVLKSHAFADHSSRLELIIIALIAMEIVIATMDHYNK